MRAVAKHKYKSFNFIILYIIFIVVILIVMNSYLKPIVNKISEYEGKLIATKIISTAVYNAINNEDFTYETLVKVTKNNLGYVSSIESNMAEINRLQAAITYNVNKNFTGISKQTIKISSGTLSGIKLLYGRGPNITMKIEPVGYVDSKLASKFIPAGVNQTNHQIILEVNCKISVIIPGFANDMDVKMNYLIAETVIVGDIPENFTYITGDNRDNLEKILDYKN